MQAENTDWHDFSPLSGMTAVALQEWNRDVAELRRCQECELKSAKEIEKLKGQVQGQDEQLLRLQERLRTQDLEVRGLRESLQAKELEIRRLRALLQDQWERDSAQQGPLHQEAAASSQETHDHEEQDRTSRVTPPVTPPVMPPVMPPVTLDDCIMCDGTGADSDDDDCHSCDGMGQVVVNLRRPSSKLRSQCGEPTTSAAPVPAPCSPTRPQPSRRQVTLAPGTATPQADCPECHHSPAKKSPRLEDGLAIGRSHVTQVLPNGATVDDLEDAARRSIDTLRRRSLGSPWSRRSDASSWVRRRSSWAGAGTGFGSRRATECQLDSPRSPCSSLRDGVSVPVSTTVRPPADACADVQAEGPHSPPSSAPHASPLVPSTSPLPNIVSDFYSAGAKSTFSCQPDRLLSADRIASLYGPRICSAVCPPALGLSPVTVVRVASPVRAVRTTSGSSPLARARYRCGSPRCGASSPVTGACGSATADCSLALRSPQLSTVCPLDCSRRFPFAACSLRAPVVRADASTPRAGGTIDDSTLVSGSLLVTGGSVCTSPGVPVAHVASHQYPQGSSGGWRTPVVQAPGRGLAYVSNEQPATPPSCGAHGWSWGSNANYLVGVRACQDSSFRPA